jgi:hypothetical protein
MKLASWLRHGFRVPKIRFPEKTGQRELSLWAGNAMAAPVIGAVQTAILAFYDFGEATVQFRCARHVLSPQPRVQDHAESKSRKRPAAAANTNTKAKARAKAKQCDDSTNDSSLERELFGSSTSDSSSSFS